MKRAAASDDAHQVHQGASQNGGKGPQYSYSSPQAQQEITEAELAAMHPCHANFIPELHNATPEVDYKLRNPNPAKDPLPDDFSGSGESMHATPSGRFFTTNTPTNNTPTKSAASPQAPTRPTEPFPLTAGDRHRSARGIPGFLVL